MAELCRAWHVSADYIILGKEPEEGEAGKALTEPTYEPPRECPVCGRTARGSLCPVCAYPIPLTPPKGAQYAVITTGGWLGSAAEEDSAEEELVKYCGFAPDRAKDCRAQIANYSSFMLLRRGLDDRAVQWLTARLNRNVFQLKIVEDCGEPDDMLVIKRRAMELPPRFQKEEPRGFGGTVLAVAAGVILALLLLSVF